MNTVLKFRALMEDKEFLRYLSDCWYLMVSTLKNLLCCILSWDTTQRITTFWLNYVTQDMDHGKKTILKWMLDESETSGSIIFLEILE
jgi:hypothetical protein